MKIRCTNCNAAYAVDDEKVAGKKFGFECPKCGVSVVIDNRPKAAAPEKEEDIIPEPRMPETESDELPDLSAGNEELPSFAEAPFGEEGAEETAGSLPSFDEGELSAELPEISASEPETAAGEDLNYDDFEDEIEPEIDLSVLQGITVSAPVTKEDDLLDAEFSAPLVEEDLSVGEGEGVETISEPSEEEDESITIDLDSLDIDLAEPEEIASPESADNEFSPVAEMGGGIGEEEAPAALSSADEDEDESITLDLDSLDIALEESDEIQPGETPEEEETRLSLDDAGLTLDDIDASEESEDESDRMGISFPEEDADVTLPEDLSSEIPEDTFADGFAPAASTGGEPFSLEETYTGDRLPEVDFDRYGTSAPLSEVVPAAPAEDRFLDIESQKEYDRYEEGAGAFSGEKTAASGGGVINFSVDYAFHYSRIRGLFRLIGLYFITFIPHLIVYGIYSIIAGMTGMINWLMILFSGEREKDFSMLQEQSLRYGLSIYASLLNVVEDKPPFTGRRNIDYQLQFGVIYPPKYSRVLAFMRLTGVGILLLALPHLVLFTVLSIGMVLICFVSLLFTIIAGHWPSLTFDFMVRYLRYGANIAGYMTGLVDTYHSFRFE